MKDKKAVSGALSACCGAKDLVAQRSAMLLWCLPTLALFVGLAWEVKLAWLWIPAFLVMAVACLVNANRCGRLHCYFTGPIFLFAAIYVLLAAVNLVPIRPGIFLLTVSAITLLACVAERPFGKYRRRV